jgi:hypothetical protein
MKSNEVSNSKIGSVMDCVKKLEVLNEKYKDKLDPKDLEESYDGWEFFKKKKVSKTIIKNYCIAID